MPDQAYLIAMRRSGAARLTKAAAESSDWHRMVTATPGVVVAGGTASQLTVHAPEAVIQQLRQTLGESFLIEPVVTRDTTVGEEGDPAVTS